MQLQLINLFKSEVPPDMCQTEILFYSYSSHMSTHIKTDYLVSQSEDIDLFYSNGFNGIAILCCLPLRVPYPKGKPGPYNLDCAVRL